MLFGVAEDHDSNPIKIGLGKLKARGAKFVSVNPVRTGYSAIADEWIGIRPAPTACSWRADPRAAARRQDRSRISRALHQRALAGDRGAGHADDGLFARDAEGKPLVWDRQTERGWSTPVGRRCRPPDGRRRSRCPTAARRVPGPSS
jgi:hypothetical protein